MTPNHSKSPLSRAYAALRPLREAGNRSGRILSVEKRERQTSGATPSSGASSDPDEFGGRAEQVRRPIQRGSRSRMGRLPRSASPSTGKRGSLHRLLVVAAAIVLLAAVPFAESVRIFAGRLGEVRHLGTWIARSRARLCDSTSNALHPNPVWYLALWSVVRCPPSLPAPPLPASSPGRFAITRSFRAPRGSGSKRATWRRPKVNFALPSVPAPPPEFLVRRWRTCAEKPDDGALCVARGP